MPSPRRILVTGCAGFIGWKVCEHLLAVGDTIAGIDNLNDAYDPALKHWRLRRLQEERGFGFERADIADRESLRQVFAELARVGSESGRPFEAVINLAARAGVRQSIEKPWVYFETNVTGTLNLLELCREFGVRNFVLASSSSVYGATSVRPFREDADTSKSLSPYAASKKSAETLCHAYAHLYGIDMAVLRFFTVYGPAGRPDMSLFRFVQRISEGLPITVYGDGRQERDFTYVDDIARGTVSALQVTGYEVINLGSDRPIVLNVAISLVESLVGRNAQVERRPRHPADVEATWADITRAGELLGWRPQTPFADGVRQLVTWYRENREWAKDIRTD